MLGRVEMAEKTAWARVAGRPLTSDKPRLFKSDDRVILQSVNDTAIYGTVRWVGDVGMYGLYGQSVPFVGIETVSY